MIHVLIADSNSIERRYLQKFFQKNSRFYNVVGAAESRQQLLSYAGHVQPDILFLDTEFDQGNWLPIAKAVRRLYPGIAIILNSLYPDFSAAQEAILLGVNAYLLKPADEKTLTETLNNIDRFKPSLTPAAALPAQLDAYPFAAEQRLLDTLREQDRERFIDEAAQYLFALETAFHGQDFRPYVCHLFLQLRWLLEHHGVAPVRLSVIDTDLHIRNIMTTPHFQAMKAGIQHFFEKVAQLLLPAKGVQTSCAELVTHYIRENFHTKITLEDLSERFHFNPAHIARCLKRSVGTTLNDYVNGLRVAKATELLTRTDLPIAKIAHATGYANVSHFNRVYRDKTALTPTAMRRQQQDL